MRGRRENEKTKKRARASLSNQEKANDLDGVKFKKDNFSRKYPLLPLRSPKEIPHQLFESTKILEDSVASHMHSTETRLVDENERKPISLEKDESNHEDLIDLMFGLGWLDNYIF